MVEDSLFALSKRVPQISAAVNHEINLVNENMGKALEGVPERKTPQITSSQQYVMTSFNNLALMLDEALKQMQMQSANSKPGSGSCNKPGGSGSKPKPSAGQLKKMQEGLSKQLEELKKQGKNQGKSSGQGQQLSQQLAETAAKQAAIRKAVEEKAAELNQDGSGNGNELKQIAKEMEELQKDIVNNQIDQETLQRQRDIEIRLLKAEEAERTRDKDNERKSNEARDYPSSNPMKYEEYMRRKEQETELLKTVPPSLKPYYKEKVNSYFNKLGAQ
jgi:DNA repair exonuclease SbcCD ATPase subunit